MPIENNDNERWVVKKSDGTVYGPVDIKTLRRWIQEDRIIANDYISIENKEEWKRAYSMPVFLSNITHSKSSINFESPENTRIVLNKWKIATLTLITWLIFSLLAKWYYSQMYPNCGVAHAQQVIWSWMSFLMGIFMSLKLRKFKWFLIGLLFFATCQLPCIGLFVGIAYFVCCYIELERNRLTNLENNKNNDNKIKNAT